VPLQTSRSFVFTLLDWHRENGRHELPWREPERTAFEILIAEVLLQQTTASAVSGVYIPPSVLYPTPECVVAATSDELAEWIAPLGLTKRASYLRHCSGSLLERDDGEVPHSWSDLLDLHGVGEYTARSVTVHAYGENTTAVDTNVRSLVSRFFGIGPESNAVEAIASVVVLPTRAATSFTQCWTSPQKCVQRANPVATTARSGPTAISPRTPTAIFRVSERYTARSRAGRSSSDESSGPNLNSKSRNVPQQEHQWPPTRT
jgi:A/G-specific adenine glycosylase